MTVNTMDAYPADSRISESCYSPSGRIPLDFVRFKPTLADKPSLAETARPPDLQVCPQFPTAELKNPPGAPSRPRAAVPCRPAVAVKLPFDVERTSVNWGPYGVQVLDRENFAEIMEVVLLRHFGLIEREEAEGL